jgi:hypothetical protein
VNGIVRPMSGSDEIVWVDQRVCARYDVIHVDRIHVVDKDPAVDLESFDAKVAPVVADDHLVSQVLPLSRLVESLVDVAIETECSGPDLPRQREIAKAFDETFDPTEFTI